MPQNCEGGIKKKKNHEQLRNPVFNNVRILSTFSAAPFPPKEKIKGDSISLNFYRNQTKPSTS